MTARCEVLHMKQAAGRGKRLHSTSALNLVLVNKTILWASAFHALNKNPGAHLSAAEAEHLARVEQSSYALWGL